MPALPRDRVVIVTGASSGIGRATAIAFARDGARVLLAARRADRLEDVAGGIRDAGGEAFAVPTDVGDRDQVRRMVDEARRRWGTVHVLVNNAGIALHGPVEHLPVPGVEEIFRVNVLGALLAIQEVLPILRAQGCGQIVNVSSTLGRVPVPLMAAYGMTKHAVEALSESLRLEVRDSGIDVIVIAPGLTSTDFQQNTKVVGLPANPARDSREGMSADRVARAILAASRKRRRRVSVGWDSWALQQAHAWAPRMLDRVLLKWLRGRDRSAK